MHALIVGVKPTKEWDQETNSYKGRSGTTYTILALKKKGPVLIDVKMKNNAEAICYERIKELYANGSLIWGDFPDYEEDVYARNNQIFYTASASQIIVTEQEAFIEIE